jgi:uncharacterized protein DUF3631/DnaB helicase-like protein
MPMPKKEAQKQLELPDLWQIAFDDERRVVGGCLQVPSLISKCRFLTSAHFTNSGCGDVWAVMAEFDKQGIPWDFSSIESELSRKGIREPAAILASLTEGIVGTDVSIERAAFRVRQMSLRCRVVKDIERFQSFLLDPASDLNDVLQSVRRSVAIFTAECDYSNVGLPSTSGHSGSGAAILEEIATFVGRFVILSKFELYIISLWITHTWAFEASDVTPYLAITSAEMRSGKTRLLEILDLLVRCPWRTGRLTAAVLARKIDRDSPTLLLDEWDATARGNQEFAESLRGILNAGHRRNGIVSLCGPKTNGYEPLDLGVFCPKVIAGIGKLPETIADRSIPIRLKRKAPGEKVERFRTKTFSGEANALKSQLRNWVVEHLESLRAAQPKLPDFLSDRQQEGSEPLLAISDSAGGEWPARARAALREIHSRNSAIDESVGTTLLSDIRDIFRDRNAEELTSKSLAENLAQIEGRPWPAWDHSRAITPTGLARLLSPFDIFPRNLRFGLSIVRGYRREWFIDSWNRYLPHSPFRDPERPSATPLHPAADGAELQLCKRQLGLM